MVDWRSLKIGDRLVLRTWELGEKLVVPCSVIEIYEDHAILHADLDYNLWLDENFAYMFYLLRK